MIINILAQILVILWIRKYNYTDYTYGLLYANNL